VLHAVPKQVLEQLREPTGVRRDGSRHFDAEVARRRLDVAPRRPGDVGYVDRLRNVEVPTVPGQVEEVVDELLHAVEGCHGLVEVFRRFSRVDVCESAPRDL